MTATCSMLFMGTLAIVAALGAGCVGVYNNRPHFMTEPQIGMSEADLIKRYGTPSFSGFALDQKIYTYKVRDNKYIVLVGLYEGYDLVVVCEGGEVKEIARAPRPTTLTILHPAPWAEGLD